MSTKELAILAARTLDAKKGEDIEVLEISSKSTIADYLILVSASNERLAGALANEVEDEYAKNEIFVKTIDGKKESGWILLDYGDIIISVLTEEMRSKYNIEKLWGDCESINWEE